MSFEAIVDEGQRAIKTTTAHFEPMAQVRLNILFAHIDPVFVIVLFCCTLLYAHSSFAIN